MNTICLIHACKKKLFSCLNYNFYQILFLINISSVYHIMHFVSVVDSKTGTFNFYPTLYVFNVIYITLYAFSCELTLS